MTEIEKLTKERDEARAWVAKLMKETQTLTCVYCGKEYPPGSPAHGSNVLTEHIKVCEKHPMREAEAKVLKLRNALIGLIGSDDKKELESMEGAMRILPGIEKDKIAGINAIHAIMDTM